MTTTAQGSAPAPAKPAAKKATGGYIVLFKEPGASQATGEDRWAVHATDPAATSASAAIRKHATETSEAGIFVAVPARSWKPVKVSMKSETKLVVEEIKP